MYDLGGGTFDVSLLTIDNGVFEVVATNGDTHLGGEDFDQRVMQHFMKIFEKKHGKDMTKDKRSIQKLRREVEKTKRALSSTHQARLEIEALYDGVDFSETLTRARFEEGLQTAFVLSALAASSSLPGAERRPLQEHPWPREAGVGRLGPEEEPGRRDRVGGRLHPNSQGAAADQGRCGTLQECFFMYAPGRFEQ